MESLWTRLDLEGDRPRLRAAGGRVIDDALAAIEAHRTPDDAGMAPEDWVAVLAYAALGGPDSLGPALVQQQPARPGLRACLSEPVIDRAFPSAPRGARLALQAGLLQIHDFWGPSHEAAQAADDLGERRFSAHWHGIAHRREPDAGNASYWFRRVGRPPVFEPMGSAARPILEGSGDRPLADRFLRAGGWNPEAMIELCVRARAGSPQEQLARRLQRLEMQLLLDATAEAVCEG